MATGSITSLGIGSNLDVSSILTSMQSLESQGLERLKTQATSFNTKLSNIGKVQSYMSDLRDKANALVSPTLWSGTTATSSDASIVKVGTGTAATSGSYAIEVKRLATGQTLASSTFESTSTKLGAGTLSIDMGRYAEDGSFSTAEGSSTLTIDLTEEGSSLSAIRDKINAAGGGVVAGIVNDASGARLTLRSRATGEESAFRISATEASDDGNAGTGLSALAYQGPNAGSPMQRTASAANADLTVNGISVSSASNTLDNVVDGLTLTLGKTTTQPVQIDVASDTASIKTAITDFATAFNTLAGYVRSQTAYNAETKVAGALQGDQGMLALQSQLRGILNEGSSASSSFSRLSDIGLVLKSDGTLETKTTKLDSALNNLAETRKLLVADGASSADSGFARRFKQLADATLGSEGMFENRTTSIRQRITDNGKAQDREQLRIDAAMARLQSQYSALDTKMSSLNSLSTYVSQQMALLTSSS